MYTFIYITVIIKKLQRAIFFTISGLTPLNTHKTNTGARSQINKLQQTYIIDWMIDWFFGIVYLLIDLFILII